MPMRLGCHISRSKGFLQAAQTAHAWGATAYQYFPKNPRSLECKGFDVQDAQSAKEFCRRHQLITIAHSPYPVNLANAQQQHAVARSILHDLHICEAHGSLGLVVHFGKFNDTDLLQGYKNSLKCLNKVLAAWEGKALLLLENEAGQGTGIGLKLTESVRLRELVHAPEKLAFCFDSCHAFASGAMPEGEEAAKTWLADANPDYWSHVRAVHLNDSVYAYRSRRDRHANIGEGFIPLSFMKNVVEKFSATDLPMILETPLSKGGNIKQALEQARGLLVQ